MTLSINSPDFPILSFFDIPESLRQLLYKAWQNRYEEFYEESEDNTIDLEETLLKILNTFRDQDDSLCHARYVCIALILALSVEPTVKAYLPGDQKTEKIFQLVINWAENGVVPTEQIINQLFPRISVGCQAIDEALSVFKSLLKVLDYTKSQEAVLEILDYCLEGYAIFPGSQGRRDLFKWCLLEVVPAAWCLKFPESIYSIKGIIAANPKKISNKLLRIFDSYRSQSVITIVNKIIEIPEYIENRIRQPIPCDLCIVKNSIPVISFGDVSQAKVVTIGINPSSKEFLNNKQRLETLTSLGVENLKNAPIDKVLAAYESCVNYFRNPNRYWEWFGKLEPFINIMDASYKPETAKQGTACHLDLVQWATNKDWGNIDLKIRRTLLSRDIPFLEEQIQNNPQIETIILNGKAVVDEFKKLPNSNMEELNGWFEYPNNNKTKIYQGIYLNRIKIIGWSINLQSSRISKPNESCSLFADQIEKIIKQN